MGFVSTRDFRNKDIRTVHTNKKKIPSKPVTVKEVLEHRKLKEKMSEVDETWIKAQLTGIINGDPSLLGPFDGIKDVWKNEPAFVVGASYGLKNAIDAGFRFDMLDGYHSIGINHVIDDYPRFEWFLFQDKRFLEHSDFGLLENYKGRIFADVKTGLKPADNITIFYTQENGPSLDMMDGLYTMYASGLLALNLALIAGANPIYLFGCDNGGKKHSNHGAHHRKDYPFEVKGHKNWKRKYKILLPKKCKAYAPFKNRVVNVDPLGDYDFKKIAFPDIPLFKKVRMENVRNATICHVGTLPLEQMGSLTRSVFNNSLGNHVYHLLDDPDVPPADIYILECFKRSHERFKEFKAPGKIISYIHSSPPCEPSVHSDVVVHLTNSMKKKTVNTLSARNIIIPGGMTTNKRIKPDYDSFNFGMIIRSAPGKIRQGFNNVLRKVFNVFPNSKFTYITQSKEWILDHHNTTVISDIKIDENARKLNELKKWSFAVFCHGDFEEVFPLSVLECMSAGLPVIRMHQESMCEMIGDSQICCDTLAKFEKEILSLLPDTQRKRKLGRKAQIRAEKLSVANMINKWNMLFENLL